MGGMCEKSDCDAFNSKGKNGLVQKMVGHMIEIDFLSIGLNLENIPTRYIYLKLKCKWNDEKKEPRYTYTVIDSGQTSNVNGGEQKIKRRRRLLEGRGNVGSCRL